MQCEVCKGINSGNCPVCGQWSDDGGCPDCQGTGMRFFAYRIDNGEREEITESEYLRLPKDEESAAARGETRCQDGFEHCEACNGE